MALLNFYSMSAVDFPKSLRALRTICSNLNYPFLSHLNNS